MSRYTVGSDGKTARCSFSTQLLLVFMAFTFSSIALALEHGAGVTKTCVQNISICNVPADCSDGNECTVDSCDTTLPDTYDCTFTARYLDDFNDTLEIKDAYDTITTALGPEVIPLGALTIVAVEGNASCAGSGTPGDPWVLPCFIGPVTELQPLDGRVQFRSNTYQPTMADYALNADNKLVDQAVVSFLDLCDGTPSGSCDDTTINDKEGSAKTLLVTGCNIPTPVVCNDDNACTVDSCNTITGECEFGPPTVCDDGNACTVDSCNTSTGECEFGPPTVCDDGNACTVDSCNTSTGECEAGPPTVCDDGNACTVDSCNTSTGECEAGPPTVCDDGNACTVDSCNTSTGECEAGPPTVCDDGNACTVDSCNTSTGECEAGPPTVCDDGNVCTLDSCNTETGECVYVEDPDATDPSCFDEDICRTPGFWATHGGDSKNRSTDITQAVMDYAGGLSVCGAIIDTTNPNTMWSSSNAMCTAVKGVKERQLVRQLTAHALNCVMSGGGGDCVGTGEENLHTQCNLTCQGLPSEFSINECISQIDCFNNGGKYEDGMCATGGGICEGPGGFGSLCDSETDCLGDDEVCVPENCHTRELCLDGTDLCFQPPGPAGGVDNCKVAKKNGVYLPN